MIYLPTWEQLPDLDLYLDQVLYYINQETQAFLPPGEKALTASMINNYVKHGHLKKPLKKKYQKEHLARLLVIALAKPVFSIQDICSMIDKETEKQSNIDLYNQFVCAMQGQPLTNSLEIILLACQTIHHYRQTKEIIVQEREDSNENQS